MSVILPLFSKSLLKITRRRRRFLFGSYITSPKQSDHVVHVQLHDREKIAVPRLHFLIDHSPIIGIQWVENEIIASIHRV